MISNISNTTIASAIGINYTQPTFSVKNSLDESVIKVDSDGYCVINKLALLDNVTGRRWQISISNGELIVEPVELVDKRDNKIDKILK
jgi:hypothetical protein